MAHVGAELTQFQKLHQFHSRADTGSPFLNSAKVGCYGPAGEVSGRELSVSWSSILLHGIEKIWRKPKARDPGDDAIVWTDPLGGVPKGQ